MNNQEEKTVEQRAIIDEPMYDSKTGEYGKGYSPDNGVTRVVQEGTDGRHYHQDTDAGRISELVFDSLQFRSANGSIYVLSIDDDGKLVIDGDDNNGDQGSTAHS